MASEGDLVLTVKWQRKDVEVTLPHGETVAGLKRVLEQETRVLAKMQKLLGLKTHVGKAATDDTPISDLKPGGKIMLMGTVEADLQAMSAQEVQPHIQVADDFDDDLEDAGPVDLASRPEIQDKLRRRVAAAIVKQHHPPRPGKKCAVLDIDYTFFDLSSVSENPRDLARPHLHEFLAAIYPFFDIVIWSATGMKWIDIKLKELGVAAHPEYKITACMDYTAMVTVDVPGYSKKIFDCKPLQVLWERFPEHYNPSNTIGLVIRPFRRALTTGRGDRELFGLKLYFLKIAALESLAGLDHSRWEKHIKRELRELEEEQLQQALAEGGGSGSGQ